MDGNGEQLLFPFGGEDASAPASPREGSDAELTAFSRTLLRELQLPALAERLDIAWNPRMRSSAGRATWPSALVELNPRLADIAEEEIERTLRHELAHLVAYERARHTRIDAHGPEWQQACADLGIPGESATHRLPLPTRKQKRRWRYQCLACGKHIDRVRRIRHRVACHHCCREKNEGRFDPRFELVERKLG
ncbi:MAG: SprT-like domain-containing protein [Verrucomicrobiales bacterium]